MPSQCARAEVEDESDEDERAGGPDAPDATAVPPNDQVERVPSEIGGWLEVPAKTAPKKHVKKSDDIVGQHSRFQLYVTRAWGLSAAEVTRVFERFGTLNESVEFASNVRGVAFVKFRTRAAAKAAVDQSPIEHAGQ